MKKFYYFLSQSPAYPNLMLANSKEQVKNLLLENIGKDNENQIVNILSEEQMNLRNDPNTSGLYRDSTEYNNGNDFLNDVIKSANSSLENQDHVQSNQQFESYQPCIEEVTPQNIKKEIPIKYFEECGIQFKVQNGHVFKKVWAPVKEMENFRIINPLTKKQLASEKYVIETLDWVEL